MSKRTQLSGLPASPRSADHAHEHPAGQVESDLRLANFVTEKASVGILVGTVDGRFVRVNQLACEMSGYTREELLQMSVTDLDPGFTATDNEGAVADLRRAKSRIDEAYHRHKDGHLYPVEVTTSLLEFEGGDYIVSCVRDMTERHEAQLHKDELESRLAQAQKMEALGLLAGGIAHDFNNALTVILGYAAMLDSLEQIEGRARGAVRGITDAATRSRNLVTQLLGFSRRQSVIPAPLDLNEALLGSRDLMKRLVGEDVELTVLPGEDLGKVMLDATQLDQVVMNLVANARDAMPHGGKLTIETANVTVDEVYARQNPLARPGEYVVMAASDTGVGMDPETAVSAFEPFFTTKEKGKGTGLGLATVFGIVRQNNGFIHVYSEPGQGATFRIYFPRLMRDEDEMETDLPAPASTAGPAKGTILLVEDDELVRTMTLDALEYLGYTAIAAASAADAIRVCEDTKTPIDLVICDVVMPDMKGIELREKMNEIRPGIRVLFVSGYTSNVIFRYGVLKPGVQFLPKPFGIDELESKIREMIGSPGESSKA